MERGTLVHLANKDQIVTLADRRNVVFLDGRGLGKVIRECAVDPEQILAFIIVSLFKRPLSLKSELTLPGKLFNAELN